MSEFKQHLYTMETLWHRFFTRLERLATVILMLLMCGVLLFVLWFPFTFENIMIFLPHEVIYPLIILNKNIVQMAVVLITHFGINGHVFHRSPKPHYFHRIRIKNKYILTILISTFILFLESAVCMVIGAIYLLQMKPVRFTLDHFLFCQISTQNC